MANITQTNILDMMELYGEDGCSRILSSFICPPNQDVEDYLRNKAIPFAKQRIAITYIVSIESDGKLSLCGYYALANKFVSVSGANISNTMKKKISKFSQYDETLDRFMVSMPLIAQLGRNFKPDLPYTIKGSDLLNMALDRVLEAERIIGGKTVYIECNNQPYLYDFYTKANFFKFDERLKQNGQSEEDLLIQMLKYF